MNIKLSMEESGILRIERTLSDGTNKMSCYRKGTDDKFIRIGDVNWEYEKNSPV